MVIDATTAATLKLQHRTQLSCSSCSWSAPKRAATVCGCRLRLTSRVATIGTEPPKACRQISRRSNARYAPCIPLARAGRKCSSGFADLGGACCLLRDAFLLCAAWLRFTADFASLSNAKCECCSGHRRAESTPSPLRLQILNDFLSRVPKEQMELMRFPEEPDEYFGYVPLFQNGIGVPHCHMLC